MRPVHRILRGIAYGVPVCSLVLALFNVAGSKAQPARAGVTASAKPPTFDREYLTIAGSSWYGSGRGNGHGKGHRHRQATPTPSIVPPTSTATGTTTSTATGTVMPGASATQPAVPSATATAANTITATPVLPPVTATLPASTATVPAATATVVPVSTTAATQVPATATQVAATATVGATETPAAGSGSIFIIVAENHDWSEIKGNANAPYINGTLLAMGAHAENYRTSLGPSLPNYVEMIAGQSFGITDDAPPSSHPISTSAQLVALLDHAGVSWKTYQENISGVGCPTSDNRPYVVHHNPFAYITSVTSNTAYCQSHMRPFGELASDLSSGQAPRYIFVTPNGCDNGHDSCAPLSNPVAQTDTWLKGTVPTILASSAYKNGGVAFITWDEGGCCRGPIGLIALSPTVKAGYGNNVAYSHDSLLRTVEERLGLSPLLGGAASANNLSDLFN